MVLLQTASDIGVVIVSLVFVLSTLSCFAAGLRSRCKSQPGYSCSPFFMFWCSFKVHVGCGPKSVSTYLLTFTHSCSNTLKGPLCMARFAKTKSLFTYSWTFTEVLLKNAYASWWATQKTVAFLVKTWKRAFQKPFVSLLVPKFDCAKQRNWEIWKEVHVVCLDKWYKNCQIWCSIRHLKFLKLFI